VDRFTLKLKLAEYAIARPAIVCLIVLIPLLSQSKAQIKITVDHNSNSSANNSFTFKNVPSPVKDDAAANAKLLMIEGELDPNGSDLYAFVDGILPDSADQPRRNVFFNSGTGGGRFRLDLGSVIEISEINTYSWHPNTRAPQVYRLWASDGTDPRFNGAPKTKLDPVSCGWKLIATVDTRSDDDGGQFGVAITDSRGSLGRYRYLLFDCYVTETADNSGNTFYSEIDVTAKP
jgi:hypothetical protein